MSCKFPREKSRHSERNLARTLRQTESKDPEGARAGKELSTFLASSFQMTSELRKLEAEK
jgi:hypothetical protein